MEQTNAQRIVSLIKAGRGVVDQQGRVWRVKKDGSRERAEKQYGSKSPCVFFNDGPKKMHALVKDVVWLALKGDIPKGQHVKTKDGDRTNTHPNNLELADGVREYTPKRASRKKPGPKPGRKKAAKKKTTKRRKAPRELTPAEEAQRFAPKTKEPGQQLAETIDLLVAAKVQQVVGDTVAELRERAAQLQGCIVRNTARIKQLETDTI